MQIPTKKKPTGGNSRSNPVLDKLLLNHLVLTNRCKGVSIFDWESKEEEKKAKDSLRYLKKLRKTHFEDFVDICITHKVEYPFSVVDGKIAPVPGYDNEDNFDTEDNPQK